MKKVACYIRVSTDKQAKEGDSVPAQREALRKYIDEHDDLISAGEYIDDGISGRKFEQRGELQRLLDDIKNRNVDMIIFTKLDRWFRSIRHYTATQEYLDKYGATWLAIWEPIYDTTTPAGRLIVNQMMSIAQFEAENTGGRIRAVNEYKVAKSEVINGNHAFGYDIKEKHLVINEEEAVIVREAFKQYDITGNMRETMRYLNKTHGFYRIQKNFLKLLKNRLYLGEYRGNTNYCPPIIERELFERVQRKIGMNVKGSQKHQYIFSGLIRCAECGGKFGGVHYQRNEWSENGYRCNKAFRPLKECGNRNHILQKSIEAYLLEALPDLVAKAECTAPEAKDNTAKIERVKKKLERLKELYLNELISLDEYRRDKEELSTALSALENEPQPERPSLDMLRQFLESGWKKTYPSLTPEEKRYLWRAIIKEIVVDCGKVCEVVFL